jgi:H+/Cl- antiporter ClcA
MPSPQQLIKRTFLGLASGLVSGLSAAVFLHALYQVTSFRDAHTYLIWFLPVVGLGIGWVYLRWGSACNGIAAIADGLNESNGRAGATIQKRTAPLVFIGTLGTHLFGGSAGREGTAVQMGAALSDFIGQKFSLSSNERRRLLRAGAGAGFGAAIGAPWAGFIFSFEWAKSRSSSRFSGWWESALASWLAYGVTLVLAAPHFRFSQVHISGQYFQLGLLAVIAGLIFGWVTRLFLIILRWYETQLEKIANPIWRPVVGGGLLLVFFYLEGSFRYAGLGLDIIQSADVALGFSSVFAGASGGPVACAFMAAQLFGWALFPYAIVATWVSSKVSGPGGLYQP